jgi:hypothetical protein
MGETVAAWKVPSTYRLAPLGFVLGIAGGCVLGGVFGAGALLIDALVNEPLRLGTVVARSMVGGLYGLIFGAAAGTIGSLIVVPVVATWLRTPGVQGRSVTWVRR